MSKKKKQSSTLAPHLGGYQPTEQENAKLREYEVRKAADRTFQLVLRETEDGAALLVNHPDQTLGKILLAEALGTTDVEFAARLIHDISTATAIEGRLDLPRINFAVSVARNINPSDQLEAMLGAQLAVVHTAMMMNAGLMYRAERSEKQAITANSVNKLARTFAMMLESLKRYRTGGEQTVTVQHVSVSEGGQAIVGNVTHAPSVAGSKKYERRPPALTHRRQPAMPPIAEPKPQSVAVRRRQDSREDGRA